MKVPRKIYLFYTIPLCWFQIGNFEDIELKTGKPQNSHFSENNVPRKIYLFYRYSPCLFQIGNFEDVDRDQLLCVSYGKAYQRPRDSIHGVEVKANYSRARKQYGPDATDIVVEAQKNPKIEVSS